MSPRVPGDYFGPLDQLLRSAERIKVEISIAYSFETSAQSGQKGAPYAWGILLDISERGLCFKANDHFYVQKLLSLQLKLSDQSSGIRMLGKIVWTQPEEDGTTRVGVQFIGTLPSDWRKLVLAAPKGDSQP